MKSKLGIVGPEDTVNVILEVSKEFSNKFIVVPFIYSRLEETKDILIKHKGEIDVWLYGGQAPYAISKNYVNPKSGFYPQLNGSSLTKVLLDISYKDKKKLTHLSFDTIPSNEVLETFMELELNPQNLKLYPYSGYKPVEELVKFHYELYKEKEVHSCVTGVHSVYKKLREMNVPAYRIRPTKMAIRDTMLIASQRSEIIQFQSSQIAILILQINEMNRLISKSSVSFEARRLSLSLQEIVIEFAEKIHGSFIQQGIEKYVIFSTRGMLEGRYNQELFYLLEKIKAITSLPANIGIGYGSTVLEAEQNGYIALNHANDYGKNTIMLADEQGNIEGPLQHENNITFNRRTNDVEIMKKLKLAGVNVSTFNKILSIQDRLRQGYINANEMAKWLGMTPRNARRILGDLEKNGLAKIVGEETPGARGRPRRLFQIGKVK